MVIGLATDTQEWTAPGTETDDRGEASDASCGEEASAEPCPVGSCCARTEEREDTAASSCCSHLARARQRALRTEWSSKPEAAC